MDNKDKVIQAFQASAKALSASQVAQATGVDKKEVDKIMGALKKEASSNRLRLLLHGRRHKSLKRGEGRA